MDQYLYLMWTGMFLAAWLLLYIARKDTRNEILFVSLLFGVGGLASEKTYVRDWWQPLTVTGTSIGIEDFFIGFAIGGVAAVIYEELYHQRLRKQLALKGRHDEPRFILFVFPLLYLALIALAGLHSFYATAIALIVCTGYMLLRRPDLMRDAVLSGLSMTVIGISIYFLVLSIEPAYIRSYWYLPDRWFASLLWGIPLAEYIWYFLVGAFVGPLYEYVKRLKLEPLRLRAVRSR